MVCDDILSALDSETAAAVFRDIFSSDGILKRQGRTAVVATHSGRYSNIPTPLIIMLTRRAVQWLTSADQVLVIKKGKVNILIDEEEIAKYSETAVLSSHPHSVVEEEPASEALDEVKAELEFAHASQGTRATDIGLYAFMLQAVPRLIVIGFCFGCGAIALVESFPGE